MRFKNFSIQVFGQIICFFFFMGCGVKSRPIAPPGTQLPSITDYYMTGAGTPQADQMEDELEEDEREEDSDTQSEVISSEDEQ